MVKAAKKVIYGILGNANVSDEELMTAFTGAEALINSRPLSYQSTNSAYDVPLTPNYFLLGKLVVILQLRLWSRLIITLENDGDEFRNWCSTFGVGG